MSNNQLWSTRISSKRTFATTLLINLKPYSEIKKFLLLVKKNSIINNTYLTRLLLHYNEFH